MVKRLLERRYACRRLTLWKAGEVTADALLLCMQSAATSRTRALQLVQGQLLFMPTQNKLVTFGVEGFMGKVSTKIPDSEWTFLRNQEVKYDDRNCIQHHL